jgi:hypothetical protein
VTLTEDGLHRLTDIERAPSGLERRRFSDLGAEDRSTLYNLLQRAATTTCGGKEEPPISPDCMAD